MLHIIICITPNSLGLLLDFIGVVGLLFTGFPSLLKEIKIKPENITEERGYDKGNIQAARKMERYNKKVRILSYIFVSFIIGGFIMQFLSSLTPH